MNNLDLSVDRLRVLQEQIHTLTREYEVAERWVDLREQEAMNRHGQDYRYFLFFDVLYGKHLQALYQLNSLIVGLRADMKRINLSLRVYENVD